MRCAFFLGLIWLLFSQFSYAEEEPSQQQLSGVQSKIKALAERIGFLSKKKSTLQEQLARTEKQYGRIARTVKNLDRQLLETENALQKIQTDMALQRRAIKRQIASLEEQFRAAYAMGRREKLKLMLNQQDPVLSSRMLVYYNYFNQARLNRLDEVSEYLKELNSLEQQNLSKSNQLAALKASKQDEQKELAHARKQRQRLIDKIAKKAASKQKQLLQLKADEKQLLALIGSLKQNRKIPKIYLQANKPFAKLKGALPWPAQGKLAKKFGSRRAESRWDGVLITGKEGTEIHAVNAGKVVYADWLRGYGLLLILDHGNSYMTLYAFNQTLFKAVGDQVVAGEVIAAMGQSGGRTQAGLYFGIRKKGKALDPVKWCKRTHKGRTG